MALLGYGTAVQSCLSAADSLEAHGLQVTVADARFCKPLDHALIRSLAKSHEVLITVEEGTVGGFGSHVSHFMALDGLLDGNIKVQEVHACMHIVLATLRLMFKLLISVYLPYM